MSTDGLPIIGNPEFLFDMRANVFNARNSYIPSRDGKRFLINMMSRPRMRRSASCTTGDDPSDAARHPAEV